MVMKFLTLLTTSLAYNNAVYIQYKLHCAGCNYSNLVLMYDLLSEIVKFVSKCPILACPLSDALTIV